MIFYTGKTHVVPTRVSVARSRLLPPRSVPVAC